MNGIRLTPVQLIEKKRDGGKLSENDIEAFVKGVIGDDGFEKMEDVQIGSMLMAIFLKGLDIQEATHLTKYMKLSGEVLEWPLDAIVVDKHSTGGVGDKVSIPLAPLLASVGAKVPMISGRGLGHTGGTLDKLESIPGYNCSKTVAQIQNSVEKVGCVIVGTTDSITPADKIIYKSRDISGTVWCNGLIYASILSKKAAEGVKHLVLDLKCGRGCWLDSMEKAEEASEAFTGIAKGLGINCVCMITNMDTPLGFCVGNALEIKESVEFLKKGRRRATDLEELVLEQGAVLMKSAKVCATVEEAKKKLMENLENGKALEKFEQMLEEAGVSCEVASKLCSDDADCYSVLPDSKFKHEIVAQKTGIISGMIAVEIGKACNSLGAGRKRSSDKLKLAVGIEFIKKLGDRVYEGTPMAVLHADEDKNHADVMYAISKIQSAISVNDVDFSPPKLVIKY